MKNFRRICFAIVLAAAFTVPALAGDMQGPGCANPGEMNAPPCSTAPGDTQGPGVAASGDTQGPSVAAPGDMQGPGLTFAAILLAIQSAF